MPICTKLAMKLRRACLSGHSTTELFASGGVHTLVSSPRERLHTSQLPCGLPLSSAAGCSFMQLMPAAI